MLDQFAVLQWVYNVIQDFGEDPEQIAIAGQSGWTGAVLHQANSPLIKGLLKCAIGEWESRTVSLSCQRSPFLVLQCVQCLVS